MLCDSHRSPSRVCREPPGSLERAPYSAVQILRRGGTVSQQGVTVGEWPSEATLVADVIAFVTPGGVFPGWGDLRGSLAVEGRETAESVLTVACEGGVVVFRPRF